jgi:hypothetical protein
MQLSKLVIETRLRTAWSSVDLGFVFARTFWLRGFCLYLVVAAPAFGLTRLVSDVDSLLPFIILWWFKPLFERPILYFMSRELFSQKTNFLQTLLNAREWFWPSLGWILTVRRISLVRGMYAPITLLERPVSSAYSQRASVLGSKFSGEAMWLTLVLFLIEGIFTLSLLALFAILFPEQIEVALAWVNNLSQNNVYIDLATLMVMAAVAPFYTAAGFMLYISRRVEIEGWDIEICFREWMADYQSPAEKVSGEADD